MWKMDWSTCSDSGAPTIACLIPLVHLAINWMLVAAGIMALFMVIYTGIKFINSGGDPKNIEGARKTLTYTILGLLLIFLSFTIINLVGFVTGATCINGFGFNSCK